MDMSRETQLKCQIAALETDIAILKAENTVLKDGYTNYTVQQYYNCDVYPLEDVEQIERSVREYMHRRLIEDLGPFIEETKTHAPLRGHNCIRMTITVKRPERKESE